MEKAGRSFSIYLIKMLGINDIKLLSMF